MPLPKQCNSCGGFCGRMCIYTTKADAEIAELKDSVFQYGIENTKLQLRNDEAGAKIAKLKIELDLALDRIADMLMADDGQAYKEAERFYERHKDEF